ncbi:hypothetical protein K488DRAFT_83199 [Vararia minispora EC-137]|uniref:Uncharacterized protein n=1 Tax=Vararia minispora EC-137 TaxID=1314806 RepID=A0ACB8QU73_9AGAM|nr:hypothetical protein K488DRAFT_83199 [Vararia minispora EC-137]
MSVLNDHSSSLAHATSVWTDFSQPELERVLRSRLVETFITITVPPQPPPPLFDGSTPTTLSAASPPHSHDIATSNISQATPPFHSYHKPPSSTNSRFTRLTSKLSHVSRPSAHFSEESRDHLSLNMDSVLHTRSSPHSPSSSLSLRAKSVGPHRVPDYISAVHHASTNPAFPVDFRSPTGLPPWTDRAAGHVSVSLWAKLLPMTSARGKCKARAHEDDYEEPQWKLMEEWIIDLADLTPLPEELRQRPSRMPFNTLLFSLSTSDDMFYVSAPQAGSLQPPSPSAAYSSDPETSDTKDTFRSRSLSGTREPLPRLLDSAQSLMTSVTESERHRAQTAGWQDLLKLASLHSVLSDTRLSLAGVIHRLNEFVAADEIKSLKREVSERQARVDEWRMCSGKVRGEAEELIQRIHDRRLALQDRREELELAALLLKEERGTSRRAQEEFSAERTRSAALRAQIEPMRTLLISELSFIFPIELRSGPDLLYTILDVPLPIPQGTTDPAPPLVLPAHKDVNEDSIASALGYAALAVQLLATYTDRPLVYPITFIGSRSIVHDGISAMVGPRMFPLFSRGVDAKRFMYGVFLLNKDIELLMAERDLRALDMRHTLPNLKNLLLTLTAGDVRPPQSSLVSPPPSRPTTPPPAPTPSAQDTAAEDAGTSSGSTTPKSLSELTTAGSRLSFFSFSGFLRAKAAQTPSVRAVPEEAEQEGQAQTTSEADGPVRTEGNDPARGVGGSVGREGAGAEGAEKGGGGGDREGDVVSSRIVASS